MSETEDINLIAVGVEALADIARDRNVDAQNRLQAAVTLINIARDVAKESEAPKPNRAQRRVKSA